MSSRLLNPLRNPWAFATDNDRQSIYKAIHAGTSAAVHVMLTDGFILGIDITLAHFSEQEKKEPLPVLSFILRQMNTGSRS